MCLPAFGETKGKNHFSGFSSVFFFLRGWGGVFNSLRRTSSGLRGGSSFWRDESGFIGKPSEGKGDSSNKDALIDWVAGILSYWEDSNMLSTDAAEIIVNEISKIFLAEGSGQKDQYPLPEPRSFYQDQRE
jgi:hypothetical protein